MSLWLVVYIQRVMPVRRAVVVVGLAVAVVVVVACAWRGAHGVLRFLDCVMFVTWPRRPCSRRPPSTASSGERRVAALGRHGALAVTAPSRRARACPAPCAGPSAALSPNLGAPADARAVAGGADACRRCPCRRRASPRRRRPRASRRGRRRCDLFGRGAAAAGAACGAAAGSAGGIFAFISFTHAAYSAGALRLDHDRHEAVLLAADLAALAAVDAGLVDGEPRVLHEAGDAVLVHAQLRHVPAVDHVVRGDEQAHLLAHRAPPSGRPPRGGSCSFFGAPGPSRSSIWSRGVERLERKRTPSCW